VEDKERGMTKKVFNVIVLDDPINILEGDLTQLDLLSEGPYVSSAFILVE
jgi:hypothetical protein